MMKSFTFLIKVVILIVYCSAGLCDSLYVEEPSSCKVLEPTLPQARLKMHIFCNYEQNIRPSNQNKNTTINLLLFPKLMEFDSGSNKFTLNSWLKLDWYDDHLKWSPEDFGGVTDLHVESHQIWLPDLSLFNSANLNSDLIFSSTASCLVAFTGMVVCIPFISTTVHCSSDYENWPFEKQICQIDFSSYFHYPDEITLKLSQDKIMMDHYAPHQEWSLVNVTAKEGGGYIWPVVSYEFHLKRHAGIMLTLYVIPVIVLMMLALVILWMDVNSVERITLGSINFICHLFCLYDLHWQIVANGSQVPYLLVLYQNSLALAVFIMVQTLFLRNLQVVTTSPPSWISSVAFFFLRYQIGRLFMLNDEEAKFFVEIEEVENSAESMQCVRITTKNEDVWKRFAKIVECLSFFSVFFTYVVMFLTFIPTK